MRRDFYVRQLRDWKGSADTDQMVPQGMAGLRPALRLDPGPGPRPLGRSDRHRRLPGHRGKTFDNAIASFSESYADQNERDYDALLKAML